MKPVYPSTQQYELLWHLEMETSQELGKTGRVPITAVGRERSYGRGGLLRPPAVNVVLTTGAYYGRRP